FSGYGVYHSSYGPTVDGLQKPEVIAPGIWVAAPILPGTPTARAAELLMELAAAPDGELPALLERYRGLDPRLDAAAAAGLPRARAWIEAERQEQKLISKSYKHVDGTSFAAPIVASLAAQMLEARPELGPGQLKRLLLQTARR